MRSRRASVSSIRSITFGCASRKSATSSGGTYRHRSGARATTSATVSSPSSAEISPKKLPFGSTASSSSFEHDARLAVDDHVQADVDLAAADDPLSLVERDLSHARQQVLQLVATEIGEERQTRGTLDEGEVRSHRGVT